MIPNTESLAYQGKHLAIEEAEECKESTTELRSKPKAELTDRRSLQAKKETLGKFYAVTDEQQRKELVASWPSPAVNKLLARHGITEMRNNTYMVGEVINNVIHGHALVFYSPARFYEGNFQNNSKHGFGLEVMPNGVYMGNYVNNKPEGRGTFLWNNEEMYEGEFLAGLKHGSGRWTSKNETYVGEWRSNKPEGMGVIITDDSRYEGEIRTGFKHGQGKELFKNGDKYAGNYVNGRPEGQGEYLWAKNSSSYRGGFKNGLRHGTGIWVQGGDRYEGHYLNDRKNGKGCFRWASGNTYTGCYFDDLRHGYGEMKWADGSWYKGEWKYGVQQGVGEMCEKGLQSRRGIFENNTLISEEDIGKKLKLERLHKKTHKPEPITKASHLITLPDMGDAQFHKRIPSFMTRRPLYKDHKSLSRSNVKPVKNIMSLPKEKSRSTDQKFVRNSLVNDKRHRAHEGEIVRNRSSIQSREQVNTENIIRWSTIRPVDTLNKTTKIQSS